VGVVEEAGEGEDGCDGGDFVEEEEGDDVGDGGGAEGC